MMPRRFLVLGSHGWIGSAILRELLSREALADVVHWSDRTGMLAADLTVRQEVDALLAETQPTHVIHAAGLIRGEAAALYRANVETTRVLCDALSSLRVQPLLAVISSASVYGNTTQSDCPVSTLSPVSPVTDYGRSKAAQEEAAAGYCGPLQTVRLFNVLGAGQPMCLFPSALVGNAPRVVHNPSSVRDWSDLRDVAAAVVFLAKTGRTGTHDVGSGVGVRNLDLTRQCLAYLHGDVVAGVDAETTYSIADIAPLLALGWQRRWTLAESVHNWGVWALSRPGLAALPD